jgi:DNA-binding PadR family transcriptional regulator
VVHRDIRSWTELSMSSIYKLLRKLEKAGFVTRTNRISAANRLRALYRISKKGTGALLGKLEALLSEPEHMRWGVDVAIYNCNLLSRGKARVALEKYRETVKEKIKWYERLLKCLQDEGCSAHQHGVVSRPTFLLRGDLQWAEDYLARLDANLPGKNPLKVKAKGE